MSIISELVGELRAEAKSMGKYGVGYTATLLMRSADTIEMLSEKARGESQADWYWRCPKCDHIVPNLYDECVWCLEPKPKDEPQTEREGE